MASFLERWRASLPERESVVGKVGLTGSSRLTSLARVMSASSAPVNGFVIEPISNSGGSFDSGPWKVALPSANVPTARVSCLRAARDEPVDLCVAMAHAMSRLSTSRLPVTANASP